MIEDEEKLFLHQSKQPLYQLRNLSTQYPFFKNKCTNILKKITEIAKSNIPKKQKHQKALQVILNYTSDSAEQLVLLRIFYKLINYSSEQALKYTSLRSKQQNYRFISDKEAEKIKELRKQGYSYYKIAKMLNRNVSTIYYYCKRNNL